LRRAEEVKDEIKQLKHPIIEEIKSVTLEVKEPIRKLQETLPEDIRREVKEPIIEEIKEVKEAVDGIERTVDVTYQQICEANFMANIQMEQLSSKDDNSQQIGNRNGKEVVMMTDDFLQDEPVFLMRRGKDHRMRVSLVHRHDSNVVRFKIRRITVKPSDGSERELDLIQADQRSRRSEIVALFQSQWFPSSKLCLGCPQLGSIQEKYVEISMTIGVEVTISPPGSGMTRHFDMNGRIWCLPVSNRSPVLHLRRFARFANGKWKRAPQWMRDAARGAIILTKATLAALEVYSI